VNLTIDLSKRLTPGAELKDSTAGTTVFDDRIREIKPEAVKVKGFDLSNRMVNDELSHS
jgi:hypothetical protein